ncbi:MAG: YidH family protein [Acidimicrobiales bacterium]
MPETDGGAPDEPQQLVLMRQVVELSAEQTRLSAVRSEMSAERTYMNAERTLSVWIRTALAAMVVGIAVDRFGLATTSQRQPPGLGPDSVSTGVGAALVAFGVLIAVVMGIRFRRYATAYLRSHRVPEHHGPFTAPAFALLAALFGVVLFVLLLVTP